MIYDLVVIGGGPAGITAGIYATRKALNVLLISKDFFGQTGKAHWVENYPGFKGISGLDLLKRFKEHLEEYPLEIKEEEVKNVAKSDKIFEVETISNYYQTKTIIVASGRNPRPLTVKGEKEFLGKGVSYCVVCDGPLFREKAVAVVGGGNAGFTSALELSKYCPKIYIFEAGSKIIADEILQERAKESGKIEVLTEVLIKEIKGEERVSEIIFEDKKNNKEKNLKIEGVFIEIGSLPATSFLNDLVDFNEKGEIKIDPLTCATKTKGLFAAGDVTDILYKQIIIAAGEGAKASLSAYNYLQKIKE